MTANRQPYYHEVQVMFTTTTGARPDELEHAIRRAVRGVMAKHELLADSVEVMDTEPEPGDPSDLM